MPPEIIAGRYRIEREVGRGGMGAVWLATDERLGRPVAVKQVGHLPGELVPDLARAMREARSSAALNHRNVVAVYDAIEEGDHIWLVMEYVPGRTLSEIVKQEGPVSPERAAWIGAQVADGLAAAHELGTVHRDVKPGNILITDGDVAKISDFGIARTLGEEKITQSGLMTGTPAYFSPELARGADPSPSTDVWALGATLYAAVEGRSPYPDQANALAMLATIARDAPPPPQRAGALAAPIGRMMDPDESRRWGMADCAHALHQLHDAHTSDRTREQTAVAAAVPAAAPAAAAASDSAPAHDPEPTPVTPVPPPPVSPAPASSGSGSSRTRRVLLVLAAVAVIVILVAVASTLLGDPDEGTPAAQDPTPNDTTSQRDDSAAGAGSTDEPAPEETEETEESEPAPEETTEAAPPVISDDAETFVADYYALLPSDTRASWELLSPDYQSQTTYGKYSGFWRTIDAVSVSDTRAGDDGSVEVDLTYTTDGSEDSETRVIYVEETDDGYLIAGDELTEG